MAEGFNPFKVIDDIGKGAQEAAGAVQGAAFAAADAVGGAVGGAVDAVAGAVGEAVEQITTKPKPEPRYTGRMPEGIRKVRSDGFTCEVLEEDYKGRQTSGRYQYVSLTADGVQLHASDSKRSAVTRTFEICNCSLFSEQESNQGNPLVGAYAGAVAGNAIAENPFGAAVGAAIGVHGATRTHEVWYAELLLCNGDECMLRLNGKSDGSTLLEFLDTYMRIGE